MYFLPTNKIIHFLSISTEFSDNSVTENNSENRIVSLLLDTFPIL